MKRPTAPPDFPTVFRWLPGAYLVLEPDFTIVAASDAYLQATGTTREELIGFSLLDVLSASPDEPAGAGSRDLKASLERVLADRTPDRMPAQRYEVRRSHDGGPCFEVAYGSPLHVPVFADDGTLTHIIHQVEGLGEFG